MIFRCNTGATKSASVQQILENSSLRLVSEMMKGFKFLPCQKFKSCTKDVKMMLFSAKNHKKQQKATFPKKRGFGGRYRTRTCDPLHVKQVL